MTKQPIKIWRWEDAPPELKALSEHGGDEEGVVLLPEGTSYQEVEWLDCLWDVFGPPQVTHFANRVVVIWAHS